MSTPDATDTADTRSLRDVLVAHGLPVTQEGLERARTRLATARASRDPKARAALRARLSAA